MCASCTWKALGCYGDSGADHAAGEAALLAQAMGRPVRVQWMRQDEHAWEPKGPAMVMQVRGALDGTGMVAGWDYQVWTPTHTTRSGGQAGNLLPGRLVDPPAPVVTNPNFGGDVNAMTNYAPWCEPRNGSLAAAERLAAAAVGAAQPGRDGQYLRQRVVHG